MLRHTVLLSLAASLSLAITVHAQDDGGDDFFGGASNWGGDFTVMNGTSTVADFSALNGSAIQTSFQQAFSSLFQGPANAIGALNSSIQSWAGTLAYPSDLTQSNFAMAQSTLDLTANIFGPEALGGLVAGIGTLSGWGGVLVPGLQLANGWGGDPIKVTNAEVALGLGVAGLAATGVGAPAAVGFGLSALGAFSQAAQTGELWAHVPQSQIDQEQYEANIAGLSAALTAAMNTFAPGYSVLANGIAGPLPDTSDPIPVCPACAPYQELIPDSGGLLQVASPGTISDSTNAGSITMNGVDANGNLVRVDSPSLDSQLLQLRREAARADEMLQQAQAGLDAQQAAIDMAPQDSQLPPTVDTLIPWTAGNYGRYETATAADPIEGTWVISGNARRCDDVEGSSFLGFRLGIVRCGPNTFLLNSKDIITRIAPGTYVYRGVPDRVRRVVQSWENVIRVSGSTLQVSETIHYNNGPLTGYRPLVCTNQITARKQ